MASSVISTPMASREAWRKKKKKKKEEDNKIRWKSETQHQIYTKKLINALREVRISPNSASASSVREAADAVLATTARGRSRWSRAILTSRLKLKFRKQQPSKPKRIRSRRKKPRVRVARLRGKGIGAVQRKVRLLGGLVPGCRKEPAPVILEEVTDYIAALQMQIRVMTALVNLAPPTS